MFTRIYDLAIGAVLVLFVGIMPSFSVETTVHGKIGVIAPLTGDLSQSGITAKVAFELALHDFLLVNPDTALDLVLEDSASDPDQAAKIIQKFYEQGIHVVIAALFFFGYDIFRNYIDYHRENDLTLCLHTR